MEITNELMKKKKKKKIPFSFDHIDAKSLWTFFEMSMSMLFKQIATDVLVLS